MTLNQDVISLILEYAYGATNCVLEDCNLPKCHNCFPVKNCRCNHYKCIKYLKKLIKYQIDWNSYYVWL